MMMTPKRLYKILDFPKHLQVTLLTLVKIGSATAQEVSAITGKERAVESAYLNQLVVMQIVRKERRNRKAVFTVDLEALDW
jgi:ArsR family transcriptional regulator, lead/cadmium/zinc/bismuth-responsive transcriptional repressor